MGNNPQPESPEPQPQPTFTISHPILQQSQLHPSKNIMKTHLPANEDIVIEKWMKSLQKIKEINKEYLLVPKVVLFRENALCGAYSSLTVVYDCFPYLLMDQVGHRRKINGAFQEDQIWYLIWALSDASKSLMNQGFKLGDIRPHNIVFNQTGDIKAITSFSYPCQPPNYPKTLYQKTPTYLSPQQLQLLLSSSQTDTTSPQSSQSFSLGLTILSVMYLEDMSKLYEYDPVCYGINVERLRGYLEGLTGLGYYHSGFGFRGKLGYSWGLVRVVQRLCALDVEKRLGIGRLWEWLKPHKQSIINFKPFQLMRGQTDNSSPQRPIPLSNAPVSTISPKNLRSPIHLLQQSHRNSYQTVSAHKINPIVVSNHSSQPRLQFQANKSASTPPHHVNHNVNALRMTTHRNFVNQHQAKVKFSFPHQTQVVGHPQQAPLIHHTQPPNPQPQPQNPTNITFSNQKPQPLQQPPSNPTPNPGPNPNPNPNPTPQINSQSHHKTTPIKQILPSPKIKQVIKQKTEEAFDDDDIIAQVDRQLKKSKNLFPLH